MTDLYRAKIYEISDRSRLPSSIKNPYLIVKDIPHDKIVDIRNRLEDEFESNQAKDGKDSLIFKHPNPGSLNRPCRKIYLIRGSALECLFMKKVSEDPVINISSNSEKGRSELMKMFGL